MRALTNRQSRSVGNLGDILKHAALVELAALLASRGARVSHVDTHTFLLHAPPADRAKWTREVDELVARHPAYARYAERERAFLARTGHYRCSSGLVVDVLAERRGCAVLGEADARTRGELAAQVAGEPLEGVWVVDAAAAVDRPPRIPSGGAVLVHVDPFALSPADWASFAPALDAISERSTEAVFVVYRYSRSARTAWPPAPTGTLGPVAEIRGGPHEVAVYASAALAVAAADICGSLGWRPATAPSPAGR